MRVVYKIFATVLIYDREICFAELDWNKFILQINNRTNYLLMEV